MSNTTQSVRAHNSFCWPCLRPAPTTDPGAPLSRSIAHHNPDILAGCLARVLHLLVRDSLQLRDQAHMFGVLYQQVVLASVPGNRSRLGLPCLAAKWTWHFATCLMCTGMGFLTCSFRSRPGPHLCSPVYLQLVKEGIIVLAFVLSFVETCPELGSWALACASVAARGQLFIVGFEAFVLGSTTFSRICSRPQQV